MLAVPLRADGRVIDAMQVLNKPGGFSKSDAELLNLMAVYHGKSDVLKFSASSILNCSRR